MSSQVNTVTSVNQGSGIKSINHVAEANCYRMRQSRHPDGSFALTNRIDVLEYIGVRYTLMDDESSIRVLVVP